MKTVTGLVLFLATVLSARAEVINDSPEAPVEGARPDRTSLARLLSQGSGDIEFVGTVYYEAEEEREAEEGGKEQVLVARGRKSFPFRRGRYHAPDMGVEESRTLISFTADGWLEIRREGRARVLMVPAAKVASIKGALPEEDAKEDPDAGNVDGSVHLRFIRVAEALAVLRNHHPELAPGVEGLDLRTNRIKLVAEFARSEELRKVLAQLDQRGTQVVLELELRMPGPDGKQKLVSMPVVTITDGGTGTVSSGEVEVKIKAKVIAPEE